MTRTTARNQQRTRQRQVNAYKARRYRGPIPDWRTPEFLRWKAWVEGFAKMHRKVQ